jgi:hypothetical protein
VKVLLGTLRIDVEARRASAEQVRFTAVALQDEFTATSDEAYNAKRVAYEERVAREGIRAAGDPPEMPGLVLLALKPRLLGVLPIVDFSAETAGTGTEWVSTWKFFPRDPSDVLTGAEHIEVSTDEGPVRVVVQ